MMKNKLLKLNAVLLLGVALASLQAQTTLNVKPISGTQTAYTLSTIRKLTFPAAGSMAVTKTTGSTDNYTLTGVRYLQFGDVGTGIQASPFTNADVRLYPNPAVDVLNMQIFANNGECPIGIEIVSIDGKMLYQAHFTGVNKHQINVSQFRQGIYLCRINNGTEIQTIKFFKK